MDYAENIATSDAKAAMIDANTLGNRVFPAAHTNILRMAAVVYARHSGSATDVTPDLGD